MAPKKAKPNFSSYGNKKSGKQSRTVFDKPRTAKRQTSRTHHDGQKGNRGSSSGRGNKR